MGSNTLRRAQGDWAAGRGHGVEALYRALLLLSLKDGESLVLYASDGEDVAVQTAEGGRIAHQVKSGRSSGSPATVRQVLAAAETSLRDGVIEQFVFAHECPLSDHAAKLITDGLAASEALSIGFRDELIGSEDALVKKAQDAVLKRIAVSMGAAVADATQVADLGAPIGQALTQVTDLAVKSSPASPVILIADDQALGVNAARERALRSVIGSRLCRLDSWIARSASESDGPISGWSLSLSAPWAIDRAVDHAAADAIAAWSAADHPGHLILIGGRSGTGKTWALSRLARSLVDQADVYVLDDSVLDPPDLARLAEISERPVVVVADNVTQEDIARPVRQALGVSGIVILASAGVLTRPGRASLSLPRDWEILRDDLPSTRVTTVMLANDVTMEERRALAATMRVPATKPLLNRMRGNIRTAASALTKHAPATASGAILDAARDPETTTWVSPVVRSSAWGVPVPISLLTRIGSAPELPPRADAILQRRSVTGGPDLVSLEREASVRTIALRARDRSAQDEDLERRTCFEAMILNVDEADPSERMFARRLLASIPQSDRRWVLDACLEKVLSVASSDSRTDFAYGWLSLLGPTIAKDPLMRAVSSARPPRDIVDIVILSAALGEENARREILQAVPEASWDAEPWTRLFEATRGFTVPIRRRVERMLLVAADAHALDTSQMLKTPRSLVPFVEAVEHAGSAELRDATLTTLLELAADKPDSISVGALQPLLKLAERCMMQHRSLIALNIARSTASRIADTALLSQWEADAAALLTAGDDLAAAVLSTVKAVGRSLGTADESLTRAGKVWTGYSAYGRRWGVPDVNEYPSILTIAERLRAIAPRDGSNLFLSLTRAWSGQIGESSPEQAQLLSWFRVRSAHVSDAQAFLVLAGSLANLVGADAVADAAAWLLKRLAVGPVGKTKEASESLTREVERWSGQRCLMPKSLLLISESGRVGDELLSEYLLVIRYAARVGGVAPGAIESLVAGRSPSLHALAFGELYRRHEAPPMTAMRRQLQRAGLDESRPEAVVRRICFEARYGDLAEARRLLLVMCDLQEKEHRGAHLRTAHRAFRALAIREEGMNAALYELAARLVYLGQPVDSSSE